VLGRILGGLRRQLGRGQAAEDRAAVSRRWVEAGIAHNAAGALADAAICFERALAADPASIPALHGRAAMHYLAGEHDEAVALCDEVLERAPGHIDAWITRAFAARAMGDLEAALAGFRKAVQIEPRSGLISCVGGVLFQQGKLDEALAQMERAIAVDPDNDTVHSNRLFILNHDPRRSREEIARAHFDWGRMVERRAAAFRYTHAAGGGPDKRLKIGYVSADLRTHSVAFYLAPVLESHDRQRFEIFCYDNNLGPGDSFTRRLQLLAEHWVRVAKLDDREFAARVQADGIDILVDLSGHTGGNRLPAFALKPAPIQASWFGYMNTTGLSTIDYRITDAGLCPPGSEPFYSETLFRLPSTAVWSPAPGSPEPGPLPALRNGHVRFGSFNSWAKVSDEVVATWGRLLNRCPDARLCIIAAGGRDDALRAAIAQRFARHGIAASRLEIHGNLPLTDFLSMVASVDIALDPFPYNGGTTTMHTLWMGVPVVSLSTAEEVGRVSFGLLLSAGIRHLCADTTDAYLDAAVRLAADLDALARLRFELRPRLAGSSQMNGKEMTANLERAYLCMWHNHLDYKKSRISL
jgi:protein O-GlcNAc transferase